MAPSNSDQAFLSSLKKLGGDEMYTVYAVGDSEEVFVYVDGTWEHHAVDIAEDGQQRLRVEDGKSVRSLIRFLKKIASNT